MLEGGAMTQLRISLSIAPGKVLTSYNPPIYIEYYCCSSTALKFLWIFSSYIISSRQNVSWDVC